MSFEKLNRQKYIAAVKKAAAECPQGHQFRVDSRRYNDGFEDFFISYLSDEEVYDYYKSGGINGYFEPWEAADLIRRA